MNGATLQSGNLLGTTVNWSFGGDGQLTTAPIVLNGYVYVGSGNGNLYAVNAATGQQAWTANVGAAIPAPDEQNVSQPLTGMAAAQGLFVVPAGTTLVAYTYTVTPFPTVTISAPPSIGGSTATLAGTVNPNGQATGAIFQYGPDTTYGTQTTSIPLGSGTSALPVTSPISGLTPNSIYHFCLTATSAGGTATSVDGTFSTASEARPAVVTGSAATTTATWAIVTGTVGPNGLDTTAYFQYGPTASYGSSTPAQDIGNGVSAVTVSGSLPALTPNATYHYRLVASNTTGATSGSDATILTPSAQSPSVTTAAATSVTGTSATLNGNVDPFGVDTAAYFEYGLNSNYGNASASTDIGSGTSSMSVNAPLTGLFPDTTYYYRVVAYNLGGTAFGNSSTLTTGTMLGPPAALTGGATAITATSAVLTGMANADGYPATAYFEYGTDTNFGSVTPDFDLGGGFSNLSVSSTASGLSPGMTYYYCLVAASSTGTATGGNGTFATPPIAGPVTAYTVKGNTVTINVLANDAGGDPANFQVVYVTQGATGTTRINPNKTVSYDPGPAFTGNDSFTYTMSNGNQTASGTVTVLNLFTAAAGTYSALVSSSNSTESGILNLFLTTRGKLSGVLDFAGRRFSLKGLLPASGQYSTAFNSPGSRINLNFQVDPAVSQVSGTVATGTYSGNFAAESVSSPVSQAGTYTLLLPPGVDSAAPQGTGVAAMTVAPSGAVSIAGWLGDGTPFSSSAYVNQDGSFPFYAFSAAAGRHESIDGLVQFQTVTGQSDFDGVLNWSRSATSRAVPYAAGFSTTTALVGSHYTVPSQGTRVLQFADGTGNGLVTVDQAGFSSAPPPVTVTLSTGNTVSAAGGVLKMQLTLGKGLFSGTFHAPATHKPIAYHGAVFQVRNLGAGWFMGGGKSGTITLQATPVN